MIRSACIFIALGLTTAGSTALAAEPAMLQPAVMTDAQMDNVTAGALGDGGVLTVVLSNSFNNWTVDFGGRPGNGMAKGMANSHNPHSSVVTPDPSNNTFVFQVNLITDVNAAIAGGDATAGQSTGTQTVTTTIPTPMQTVMTQTAVRTHGNGK